MQLRQTVSYDSMRTAAMERRGGCSMITRVDRLPTVLTSFGYRSEYVSELEGMIPTVRQHHPDWPIVIGRGPVSGFELPTLEVEIPPGKCHWSLPVPLSLEGNRDASERDWSRIVF